MSQPHTHSLPSPLLPSFHTALSNWYTKNARVLPWRLEEANVYYTLVSETMLQQTRVATVISYFTKWIARWPTIQSLAEAGEEEIREMWNGLGYYSRGTRLWKAAKVIVEEMEGVVPKDVGTVAQIHITNEKEWLLDVIRRLRHTLHEMNRG